jgi:hypothetical protein
MSDSFSHVSHSFANTSNSNPFYSSGSHQSMTNPASAYYVRGHDYSSSSTPHNTSDSWDGIPILNLIRAFLRAWNEEPPANWDQLR